MSSDFVIRGELDVSVPRSRLLEYAHPDSGARHFHLDCDDDNAAFMLCFRTPAPGNNGLTHVLEHLLLSGSRRFTGAYPFFAMMKQSVATTMNASTGCDVMRLHFSTRSPRDFDTLLAFYLDSAFFPLLDQADFNREAGRAVHDASTGSTRFNGVVYNEMKGAMSRPEFHLHRCIHQRLFPGTSHGLNEGGDWWRIPALSLQEVRDYHRHHFVAASALFLTYGTVDVRRCQDRFLGPALDRCATGTETPIPSPPRLDRKAEVVAALPLQLDPPRYFHARGIRISGDDAQFDAVMARLFLEQLPGSAAARPWREHSGLFFRGREPVLVLAQQAVRPPAGGDDSFRQAIERVAADPPGRDALRTSAARLRTRLLDDQTGRDSTGVRILERIAYSAVYGEPDRLDRHRTLERTFEHACVPGNLRNWITHHLLENTDQVVVAAHTDSAAFLEVLEAERRCIGKALERAPLPPVDVQRHASPVKAVRPPISAAELARLVGPDVEFQAGHAAGGVDVVPCELGDLCYLTLAFRPGAGRPVALEQLALDIEAVRQSLERRADTLDCTADVRARVMDGCGVRLMADITAMTGRALSAVQSVLELIVEQPGFPAGLDRAAARAGRLRLAATHGHEMALKSALSSLGKNGAAEHGINGLGLLPALDWHARQAEDAATGETSLRWRFARALVLCAERRVSDLVDRIGFPAGFDEPVGMTVAVPEATADLAWLVPGATAHCALAVELEPLDVRLRAAAAVLCRILVDQVLEPAIRFEGGAYGVDCRYLADFNAIGMCSFRDPGIAHTLESFDRAMQRLHAGEFDEAALEKGRISEFARLEKLCRTRVLRIRRAFDSHLEGGIASPARYARAVTEVDAEDLRRAAAAIRGRVSRSVVCSAQAAAGLAGRRFDTIATGPDSRS